MRAILIAIAWTLAASAAHPGDQYSEGNQRRGEEPNAPAPAVLASEASTRSTKSLEGDHVLTSLEVLQLSGLLNDPIPRAQRGDIEVVEEPKPDDRGDVPGSILYGHVRGRSKRNTGSSRKLLGANKETDMWGFGEDDGLMNDQPSSDEDDQQQHIKRPMNHHRNHHRQEDYRRGQEELRRPQVQYRRPEEQFRRPQEQLRRPQEDRAAQDEQKRKEWEEQQRRRQEEEQRRVQDEERRRQWDQQRKAPENHSRDPNPRKTEAPTSSGSTYEERLREWQRMKEEHDRMVRERENARKNPNHREDRRKTAEELENDRKLQEYIRRNTPINLTRSSRPENLTRPGHPEYPNRPGHPEYPNRPGHPEYPNRPVHPEYPNRPGHPEYPNRPGHPEYLNRPGQPDNISKSGHPENFTGPAEDPRKEERSHQGQYDPEEVRRRQEEQRRRSEEERRLREEARTRSPPVNNQQQENEQVRMAELQRREKDEERRRLIQQQGRNVEDQRNRPDAYVGHRIPSAMDERRRPEDPMRHLRPTPNPHDHQRTVRPDDPASQHHESPDQNWSPGRRYPVRPENPTPDRRNWWEQQPEDEARRLEKEKCRRLLEEDERRRKEEEARRRQPSRPDQPRYPGQTRPEDNSRYHEYRKNEAEVPRPPGSYKNETEEERLRTLPVEATIIVRDDGSNYTYGSPAALTLRQGFGDEIDFMGFSPSKSGAVAASFPSPVTQHPPARSPPPCVWALVVCCRDPRNVPRVQRCFEATNCLSWDSNKCGLDNVRAANEELMNFYLREQTRTSRPLVYQFGE